MSVSKAAENPAPSALCPFCREGNRPLPIERHGVVAYVHSTTGGEELVCPASATHMMSTPEGLCLRCGQSLGGAYQHVCPAPPRVLGDEVVEGFVLEVWRALVNKRGRAGRPPHALPIQIYPDPQEGVAGTLRPILHRLAEAAAKAQRERDAELAILSGQGPCKPNCHAAAAKAIREQPAGEKER